MTTAEVSDVLVIGAGFAGTLLAHNLAALGVNTVVLDRAQRYPDVLRAEKIEHDQAEVLRRLGALEHRQPHAPPIGVTVNYRDGVESAIDTVEQYGICYHDTVNNMRDRMLGDVALHIDEAASVAASADLQTVTTRTGRVMRARLVVIASGGSERILRTLGLHRRVNRTLRSLTVGFDLLPAGGGAFPFMGFNYFLEQPLLGIDYVTLFRVGERMRVNLFTQWEPRTPALKYYTQSARAALSEHFPELWARIGPFEVSGRTQFFKTDYYRLRNPIMPGVVVIGDEYQSVCPTTGTGLSKVTTDVELLVRDCIPRWLQTSGMGMTKIAEFYRAPQKVKCDADSLDRWIYYRDSLATGVRKQWYRVDGKLRTWLSLW